MSRFPVVFYLACCYIITQATSVSSERSFKGFSDTWTKKRNRLTPESASRLVFLKLNLDKQDRADELASKPNQKAQSAKIKEALQQVEGIGKAIVGLGEGIIGSSSARSGGGNGLGSLGLRGHGERMGLSGQDQPDQVGKQYEDEADVSDCLVHVVSEDEESELEDEEDDNAVPIDYHKINLNIAIDEAQDELDKFVAADEVDVVDQIK